MDRDGELRFDPSWTRDTWGRCTEPPSPGWRWVLATDRDSGFRFLVLATSPDLLASHPRLDVVSFEDRAQAEAALGDR